ncbi:MAG TPA: FMN-binding protein [Gryllotalpicola sp.]
MIPRRLLHSPAARISALAGSGLLAAMLLAGCSASSGSNGSSGSSDSSGSSGSSGDQAAASGSNGGSSSGTADASTMKDGEYSATGHYTSPGGDSAVAVTLTLKSGVVTKVTVTPKAENPTAQQYESMFSSGVSGKIVGKKITELNVTKISGSSLTSQGFDKAIADIEQQAAA